MPRYQPSMYQIGGKSAAETRAKEAGEALYKPAISFASSAVTSLVIAAASASTVPIVGWITAAVAAAVAAVLAIVQGVLQAKLRRETAVAWAIEAGIPNAEDVPRFIVTISRMGTVKRYALGQRLTKQMEVAQRKGQSATVRELATKRQIVGILLSLESLQRQGKIPPPAPQPVLIQTYERPVSWTPVLVGGMVLLASAMLYTSRRAR